MDFVHILIAWGYIYIYTTIPLPCVSCAVANCNSSYASIRLKKAFLKGGGVCWVAILAIGFYAREKYIWNKKYNDFDANGWLNGILLLSTLIFQHPCQAEMESIMIRMTSSMLGCGRVLDYLNFLWLQIQLGKSWKKLIDETLFLRLKCPLKSNLSSISLHNVCINMVVIHRYKMVFFGVHFWVFMGSIQDWWRLWDYWVVNHVTTIKYLPIFHIGLEMRFLRVK